MIMAASVGGGEILKYWNQNKSGSSSLDSNLIRQFLLLPAVRIIIILLIVLIAFLLIIKILKVRNPFKGKTVTKELKHLESVKRRDDAILKANSLIMSLTNIFEKTPFAINKSATEYWSYNLNRANIRIPGGYRIMRPEEFKAVISTVQVCIGLIAIIVAVFMSIPIGVMLLIMVIVLGNTLPMMVLRAKVKNKDLEIVDNFADFYLMIHYTLLSGANTPLSSIMRSYDKTAISDEMHRFVDVCTHYIDTYGEYEATRYITKHYREIPEVAKLMRLIRQSNEGGDVRPELIGFRQELLNAKKYAIEKRMDKLIARAQASFNILMPVLIQAIISAMAIYFKDIGSISSFLK